MRRVAALSSFGSVKHDIQPSDVIAESLTTFLGKIDKTNRLVLYMLFFSKGHLPLREIRSGILTTKNTTPHRTGRINDLRS